MPFTETGKEKAKREAYMKANKERGIRSEKQKEYEMFGTTEQNIPVVDPMGDVITGGDIGAPSMSKAQMARIMGLGMKKGGAVKSSKPKASSASKRGDGIAQRGKTKGRMV